MRRRWIRSPLPLALAITLASIAIGLVIALVAGSLDGREPARVMLTILKYATAELFILSGAFWLIRRSKVKSDAV